MTADRRAAREGALPPGQTATRKLPVVGEKAPPPEALDLAAWRLVVDGLVERRLELTREQLGTLPRGELTADIHCVTGWSRCATRFSGWPLEVLLARAGVRREARFVRFEAYSRRGHDSSLPLALARRDCWLVDTVEGEPLTPEHGFPLRAVTPSRYFYKSVKWVRRIELLAADRLGYWERESSYHNRGDPWAGDERFTTGSLPPERLERFRRAASYAPYRGAKRTLIGLDLRGWSPASRDLRGLHLKSCDLREAQLAGADLRGANLSLSDLSGADLSGADLSGADLEGACFAGADLTGADLRETALSATRFFVVAADGSRQEARVTGLRRDGATGLLEDQEAFLEAAGCE